MRAFVGMTQETTEGKPLMYWENETYKLKRLHFISEHCDWLKNLNPLEVKNSTCDLDARFLPR